VFQLVTIMYRRFFGRKYEIYCDDIVGERARFIVEYRRRFGRCAEIQYPQKFRALPAFAEWLRLEVARATDGDDKPSRDVIERSRLPEIVATAYHVMHAHGMHLRIYTAEEDKVTCGSAVASAVLRRGRSHEPFHQDFMETKQYVGWIQEILELNYRSYYCIVLVCSWIPVDLDETNTKVVKDKYGFALGNF
jgi:hypothetical protein